MREDDKILVEGNLLNTALLLRFKVCGFPPSINTPDKEVTVSKGETAVLKCDVENLYNYKVAWLNQYSTILTFEDLRFTDDNRFYVERPFSSSWNLHISDVADTDQGKYTCSIDTKPVTSKAVNLIVSVPAKIQDELSSNDTVLRERETLVLVCNVTGVPRPFVTWYKLISGKEEKLDQTGEVLVISNVSRHDGGIYECRASNHANASKTISVTIKLHASVPTLNAPKTNVSVLEGKTAVLPCSFEKRGSNQIFWLGKHTALTLNERHLTDDVRLKVENSEAGQWNLVIENVTAADRGVYVCRVNSQLVTSKSVYLEVRVPAKIREKLSSENTTLKEGQTLVLVCNVTGVPKPVVTWYKIDARNISKLNSTGEVLIITNVSEKDGGTYECLAFNGDSSSKQISVSVEFAPKVMVLSKRIGQFRGKGAILYCHITAKPQPDMYWLKGGEDVTIIVNSSKYQVEWTVKENTDYTLSLWIMDVQAEDFGEYTCYARNALGKAKDSVVLYDLLSYFKTPKSPKSPKTSYQTVSENSLLNTATDQFNVGSSGSTFLGHAYVYIALSSTVIIWTTEYENSFYS